MTQTNFQLNRFKKKINWLDVTINRQNSRIDVDLRVNLTDGGTQGLNDNVPQNVMQSIGAPKITQATRSYNDLVFLALQGMNYHFGRNSNHPEGKGVQINRGFYEVYFDTVNVPNDSMLPLKVFYRTNKQNGRSSNPGKVVNFPSFFGHCFIGEKLFYNTGYLKGRSGWYFLNNNLADIVYQKTAAHEVGHEFLKSFFDKKKTHYSYGHKGSSDPTFQKMKKNAPNEPSIGTEVDLMIYYQTNTENGVIRSVLAEKDLVSLLWAATKIIY